MCGALFGLLSAAAALPAARALRARSVRSSAVEDLRRLCGGGGPPADLVERGLDCDPEIPRYDMDEWIARHGNVVPDHAAVFVGTHTREAQVFPDMETFLARHGDVQVVALPEYSAAGSTLKNPGAKGVEHATFRTLLNTWNDTFVYFSDFKCLQDSLCHEVARQFGIPKLFGTRKVKSRNFLVGGPDSGLPFHKHGMTWQSLAMGRKAWYMLPAGSMSEELHDATGPYIYPVRAYHPLMQQRTLGSRPLYCVQHPGEVVFVPDYWWHSTMNLDRYQVAYGEKPIRQVQNSSPELQLINSHFPAQAYDSAGTSSRPGGGAGGDENPMPYTLIARQQHQLKQCSIGGLDDPTYGLELPLSRLRGLEGSTLMRCGLADSAAWAHCTLAGFARALLRNCSSRLDDAARRSLHLDVAKHSARWAREALQLSPTLFEREDGVCGTRAALANLEAEIR